MLLCRHEGVFEELAGGKELAVRCRWGSMQSGSLKLLLVIPWKWNMDILWCIDPRPLTVYVGAPLCPANLYTSSKSSRPECAYWRKCKTGKKKGKLCLIKHGSLVISDRDATVLEVDLICFNDELLIRPCKLLGIKSQPTVSLCWGGKKI